jgi:hypothetical protein
LIKLGKLSRKHAAKQWKELEESVAEEDILKFKSLHL